MSRSTRWGARLAVGALVVGSVASCGGSSPVPGVALGSECVPTDRALAADATLADMAGNYRLVMVGPGMPPESAEGSLELMPTPASLSRWGEAATPLYGSTSVDIEAAGAYRVGPVTSDDPAGPGVLVMESGNTGARTISLRLGSEANQRDVLMFDGAYAVLWVRAIAEGGFVGGWTSGARNEEVEGYFCAQKRSE